MHIENSGAASYPNPDLETRSLIPDLGMRCQEMSCPKPTQSLKQKVLKIKVCLNVIFKIFLNLVLINFWCMSNLNLNLRKINCVNVLCTLKILWLRWFSFSSSFLKLNLDFWKNIICINFDAHSKFFNLDSFCVLWHKVQKKIIY
jgi:hypothetical protein